MQALVFLKWFWLIVIIGSYSLWTWDSLSELRLVIKHKRKLTEAEDVGVWVIAHVIILFIISLMYFLRTKGVV